MKNILLITTGLSPQVVTETLYYYSQNDNPIHFDEVHIVTGVIGKDLIINKLLGGPNYFNQYCNDYNINKADILFDENSIHVLKDENGNLLDDIKTVNQNKAAINQVFIIVSDLTEDEDTRLITSISGGRKTMSVIMGQAMQFFAREHDKIIHVIVENIMLSADFYYPTPYKKIVKVKDQEIDFNKVTLFLDELPFIRLRSIIGPLLIGDGNSSLVDIVKVAQSEIESLTRSPEVVVDLISRSLIINDQKVDLPAKNLAFYCAFLKMRLKGLGEKNDGYLSSWDLVNDFEDKSFLQLFLKCYIKMYGKKNIYVEKEIEKYKSKAYDEPWLRQTKSKINKVLKDNLSYPEYEYVKIGRSGPSNNVRHGLLLDKDLIKIINQR
jgi:CRISPR-associated protein (TIGR02584 family)